MQKKVRTFQIQEAECTTTVSEKVFDSDIIQHEVLEKEGVGREVGK